MKIGFSLGRCIRDIVNGDVDIDDVAFVIAATNIREREQILNVIVTYEFEPEYLYGLDHDRCMEVAYALWDTNRLLQPRRQGLHRHKQPENSVWVDMFPTELSNNESVKKAWDSYRFMIHMVENVDNEATEVFKV
jgi:LmbE family N-acetylglucosaminyl deacetylase